MYADGLTIYSSESSVEQLDKKGITVDWIDYNESVSKSQGAYTPCTS